MYRPLILLVFFLAAHSTLAQVKLSWADFADVTFEPKYNEKYDTHFLMPTFGEKIKAYHDKKISLTGYFLDISGTGEVLLISANPMASCFFCGAAGPESIVEVVFTENPQFFTDQVVTITGTLELNDDDVDRVNYIIKNASGKLIN